MSKTCFQHGATSGLSSTATSTIDFLCGPECKQYGTLRNPGDKSDLGERYRLSPRFAGSIHFSICTEDPVT